MPSNPAPRPIDTSELHARQAFRNIINHPKFGPCVLLEPMVPPPPRHYVNKPYAPIQRRKAYIKLPEAIMLLGMTYARGRDTLLVHRLLENQGYGPVVSVERLRKANLCAIPSTLTDEEDIRTLPAPTGSFVTMRQISPRLAYVLPQTKDQRKERAPRVLAYSDQGISYDTTPEEILLRKMYGQVRTRSTAGSVYYHLTDLLDNDIDASNGWASPHEASIEFYARSTYHHYFTTKKEPSKAVKALLEAASMYRGALANERTGVAVAKKRITADDQAETMAREKEKFYRLGKFINKSEEFLIGRDPYFEVLM